MSEPRWNDPSTRESPRQPSRLTAGGWPAAPRRASGSSAGPTRQRPSGSDGPARWGELPSGRGIVLVAGAAGLGAMLTLVTGSDPGFLLGVLVVIGTVAGSLAVDPRRAYLIIPAPPLAYLAAAILTGLIHDRTTDTSHTMLAINGARWVASAFLGMAAATVLAVVITVARWLRSSQGSGLRQSQPRSSWRRPPPGRSRAVPTGRSHAELQSEDRVKRRQPRQPDL